MKVEQVKQMTDEKLRIKVAELCGWTGPWRNGNVHSHGYRPGRTAHPDAGDWNCTRNRIGEEHCPDYPSDLNAMHEAENEAGFHNAGEGNKYARNLAAMCSTVWCWKATARQRCEAFVLTMEHT